MASTPRSRGKKKVDVLDPEPLPVRTQRRPKVTSKQADEPILPQDFLAAIVKMSEANIPIEEVLRDFHEFMRVQDPDARNIHNFYAHLQGQLQSGPVASQVKFVDEPKSDAPVVPSRTSELHNFPFWDPRGHMIDLLAKEDNTTGLPQSYHIVEKIVDKAKQGDMEASGMLFNYTIGKPTQHVEMITEQHVNHYDVSADPRAFDIVVRIDETKELEDGVSGSQVHHGGDLDDSSRSD